MTIEEIKRELKNEIVSHRNEKLCTGQTSICAMATDCLHAIEAQEHRIKELEAMLYKPCGVVTNLLNRCNNFASEDNKAMHLVNDCYMEIQSLLERIKELKLELESEKIVNAAEIKKNWEHAKRIEELESKLQMEHRVGEDWCSKYWELRASQPKWISVGERSPTKKDGDYDGDVLASNEEYPRGFLCPFDYLKRFNITHWMPLPNPPPTEDSSATERKCR